MRLGIVAGLSWATSEPWAQALLVQLTTDESAKVRALAERGLRRLQVQAATDAERRSLPDELRAVTDRHPGKWVAVAHGRVVDADRFVGRVRRSLRGAKDPDGRLYFVAPD